MTNEHADLEADWLFGELERAQEYARKAYESKDDANQKLYLTYVISTLDGLFNHYKLDMTPLPSPEQTIEQDGHTPQQRRRGLWGWIMGG